MSRTYRYDPFGEGIERPAWARRCTAQETFRCRRCKLLVGAIPCGGRQRNHCPCCLHSRHVDGRTPGDRASLCGGTMAPVAAFTRPTGEHVIVHRCLACGVERYNRIAADDDFELVLRLPAAGTRQAGRRLAPQVVGMAKRP